MYVYTFQEARVRYTVSDINPDPEVIQSCATGHLFDLHLIGGVNQRLRLLMCRFCVGARLFFSMSCKVTAWILGLALESVSRNKVSSSHMISCKSFISGTEGLPYTTESANLLDYS